MDDMTATFLRGQPHGLGVVQIFIGVLCILFSLTSVVSQLLIVHAPFCVAVTFVVSGSLALAAGRRTSVALVWACLVSNVVAVVVSLGGVVYLCWLLAARPVSRQFCETFEDISSSDVWIRCNSNMWILDVVMYGLLSSVLVLLLLQLCVAITVCVFSGKTIRHRGHASPVMVRGDEYRSLLSAAASQPGSNVALLDSEAAETSGLPPNAP
ncbi:membrane-spanning 4-domains subfamily A member 4A isoform X3 [Trachinotus anak]